MKKTILALCLSILLLLSAAGCAASRPQPVDRPLHIVTTIFPLYDWTRAILGDSADHVQLDLLLQNGVDLHSFQPTAADIVSIASCDVFIYVGGESDKWVDDALRQNANPNRTVLNLLNLLGDAAKEEEITEGMEADHAHDDDEHDDRDEPEYDEHVWLSLQNAAVLCERIAKSLESADPGYAAQYRANAAAYIEKLNALDATYADAVKQAPYKTLLFGDRFPFRYLADDYGLSYYAAFSGCSAETEASFETVVFLASKLDELHLPAILQLESANGTMAETIRKATQSQGQAILTLDSLQSVTAADVKNGMTYLGVMEQNLAVLKQALGAA